jgi:protein-disulfide isomerase
MTFSFRTKIAAVVLLVLPHLARDVSAGQAHNEPIVAIVNGAAISEQDLESQFELQQQVYELKTTALQRLISTKLLELAAKKSGLSVEEFLRSEIDAKIGPPADGELHGFYIAQPDRYQEPFENLRDVLARDFHDVQVQRARKQYLEGLRDGAKIAVLLEAPRVNVSVGDAPRLGAEERAKVTVIEFGDYQCPFCRGVQPTLRLLREKYGDKVSFVFKDYPLREIHPDAQGAAEAASCAREQGHFWDFHDAMFGAPDLSPPALAGLAKELHLDAHLFESCLVSHKFAAQIDADRAQGSQMGMSGTPAFNINGVVLTGAQPMIEFERLINQELLHGVK